MSASRQERRQREKLEKKSIQRGSLSVNAGQATASATIASGPWKTLTGVFLLGTALGAGVLWVCRDRVTETAKLSALESPVKLTVGSLAEMTNEALGQVDIARVNLLCSQNLPGRGKASDEECLRTLDRMADTVRTETMRNFHRFQENPAEYENSEIFYQVSMMLTVLGVDFGLHYNPAKIQQATMESRKDQSFFDKADDVFISGLLTETKAGTCSSMPVLSVAVGRRLGYPLKLVAAKGHLFFRWDDGKNRKNFECTNKVSSPEDAYYRNFPFPISDAEVAQGHYLRSMTPREELAGFLSIRATVLLYHKRFDEALLAMTQARLMHPGHPDLEMGLAQVIAQHPAKAKLFVSMQPGQTRAIQQEYDQAEAIYAAYQARLRAQWQGQPIMPQPPLPLQSAAPNIFQLQQPLQIQNFRPSGL
ncbi:MAG: hypothetical protein WCN98_07925 [Verrucomicrobiaceae bacterium]